MGQRSSKKKEVKKCHMMGQSPPEVQNNEIPCIFFDWLTYDLSLYNNLVGTVYSEDRGHDLLKGFGEWKIVHEFYNNTRTEIIHALIAVCDSRKEVIVAFRGTQTTFKDPSHRMTTVNDWLLGCFDAHLVYWDKDRHECGSVHHGFFKHYKSIEKQIPLKIKEYVHQGYTVTFTGHSQGGALAAYAALEVAEMCERVRKRINLITFGAPKCGNNKFRDYFKTHIPPERVLRYISSYPARVPIYDAVTRVPPPIMKFKQIYGQKRYVLVDTEKFGSVKVDFGNITKSLPLSFAIHSKEVYFQGVKSSHICVRPFTSECAKHFLDDLHKREKDFKFALCTTYRTIHNIDCDCSMYKMITEELELTTQSTVEAQYVVESH